MHRNRALILGLAAFVTLTVGGTSVSYALNGPGVIRITERQVQDGRVDIGRPGPSIGDVEVMRMLLFNKGITPKPIGHGELVCTYTGDKSKNCSGVYFLPKGKIIVSGPLLFRQFFELAVLGGTGLYSNVRGTLTVTSLTGGRKVNDVLLFRLVP
jgi:hypothetical protein